VKLDVAQDVVGALAHGGSEDECFDDWVADAGKNDDQKHEQRDRHPCKELHVAGVASSIGAVMLVLVSTVNHLRKESKRIKS